MENTLQKLIELAKADGGKFFVIDEKGNPVLVIMAVEEYQKVLLRHIGPIQNAEEAGDSDQENASRQAQQDLLKSEVMRQDLPKLSEENFNFSDEPLHTKGSLNIVEAESIDSTFEEI